MLSWTNSDYLNKPIEKFKMLYTIETGDTILKLNNYGFYLELGALTKNKPLNCYWNFIYLVVSEFFYVVKNWRRHLGQIIPLLCYIMVSYTVSYSDGLTYTKQTTDNFCLGINWHTQQQWFNETIYDQYALTQWT